MKISTFLNRHALWTSQTTTRRVALGVMTLVLSACSSGTVESDRSYQNKEREKLYKHGSVVSDEGGFSLLGDKDKKDQNGYGLGVNAFLWRASLDVISFMPIASADPFGGVITTDWYTAPTTPNERVKVNVFILDRELRADGVRVTVFRQTHNGETWKDDTVSPTTASQMEETILTRARQMKMAQKEFR